MNKFEQLIEYVINDDEAKARELFHEIVVEKSREIYENLMADESMDEGDEYGDAADDLIDDIEADEEGLAVEADEDMADEEPVEMGMDNDEDMDMDMDMDSEESDSDEDLEDRVVDLEDKLDELMAEFESLMADEADEPEHADMDMDMGDDGEDDTESDKFNESVSLSAAPKAETSEPAGTNSKSPVANNSGAKGAMAKPVSTNTAEEKGRSTPSVKDMGSTTSPKQGQAPKPVTAQASGVNTKSPVA